MEAYEMDWIPTRDKMPTARKYYLLTVKNENFSIVVIGMFVNDMHNFDSIDLKGKHRCGFINYDAEWGYYEIENVIAWMPLPSPYKEVEQ